MHESTLTLPEMTTADTWGRVRRTRRKLQAVHVRHQEIDEQDLGLVLFQQGQRLLTTAGQQRPHAFPVQDVAHELAAIRIVIDNEHVKS